MHKLRACSRPVLKWWPPAAALLFGELVCSVRSKQRPAKSQPGSCDLRRLRPAASRFPGCSQGCVHAENRGENNSGKGGTAPPRSTALQPVTSIKGSGTETPSVAEGKEIFGIVTRSPV